MASLNVHFVFAGWHPDAYRRAPTNPAPRKLRRYVTCDLGAWNGPTQDGPTCPCPDCGRGALKAAPPAAEVQP